MSDQSGRGQSPASRANLMPPVVKGEVRNKLGVNGTSRNAHLMREYMAEKSGGKPRLQNVWEKMYLQAIQGNDAIAKYLNDQCCGKAKETLEVSNPDGTLGPRVLAYIPNNGRGPRADDKPAEAGSSETLGSDDESTNPADHVNDKPTEEASSDKLGSDDGSAGSADHINDKPTEEASPKGPVGDDGGTSAAEHMIKPQPGFQERFLSSPADITIGGGSAGCGKSRATLMAPLAWIHLPEFRAVFFRRTTVEVRAPGGLWDESQTIYRPFGGVPVSGALRWAFPSGASVTFAHLEDTDTHLDWQGSSLALIVFDELCHFTEEQFWYLQSRNRSTCRVRPYTLGTCNPDPDSWVAKLIAWWINPETGLPIPERAGVLRYFTRWQGETLWGDDRQAVRAQLPPGGDISDALIQSLTFVPGKLEENVFLERADPTYRGKLMAMTRVNRARLLDGNWKIRADAGSYFRRSDCHIIDAVPNDIECWTRRWDLAATEPCESSPDPDWTCGIKMGRRRDGRFVVADCALVRKRAHDVRTLVKRVAANDGTKCSVGIPQDPAQAGKDQAESYILELAGFDVYADHETGDKETRAEPVAAQWQHGNIDVVRGPWNDAFFAQLEAFPAKGVHDDAVDAMSGAFKHTLEDDDPFRYY